MLTRYLLALLIVALCLAAAPTGPLPARTAAVADGPTLLGRDELPTAAAFAELAKTDAMAALQASLSRYRADVRGYYCTMEKQEAIGGKLGGKEVIDVTFRDDPFAVVMRWTVGAGMASATLYAKNENAGKLLARVPLLGVRPNDPNDFLAKRSSRFSIQDFGIYCGTLRTYAAWKRAAEAGTLKTEYLGTRPVPECGGRVCHVIRRTCDPPEVDNFSTADRGVKSAADYPKDAIHQVTVMFDAETFLQVGSEITHADPKLVSRYYFRDLRMNPPLTREHFVPAALDRKE